MCNTRRFHFFFLLSFSSHSKISSRAGKSKCSHISTVKDVINTGKKCERKSTSSSSGFFFLSCTQYLCGNWFEEEKILPKLWRAAKIEKRIEKWKKNYASDKIVVLWKSITSVLIFLHQMNWKKKEEVKSKVNQQSSKEKVFQSFSERKIIFKCCSNEHIIYWHVQVNSEVFQLQLEEWMRVKNYCAVLLCIEKEILKNIFRKNSNRWCRNAWAKGKWGLNRRKLFRKLGEIEKTSSGKRT